MTPLPEAHGSPAAPAPDILVVDDDRSSLQMLARVVTSLGYRVRTAASGEEALALAAEEAPRAVVLDVVMPGMDGLAVCRALRQRPETLSIPILLVTATDDLESRVRGYEAGADDYLSKPFARRDLAARLRARLDLAATRAQVAELRGVLATIRLISHEFNNPLQAVIGGLDLLQMARDCGGVDEAEALGILSAGAERLRELSQRLVHITEPAIKSTPIGAMLDIDGSR